MQKNSWLYSDIFLKRAFAIRGYYTVASLIIAAAVFGVVLILGVAAGAIGTALS
jgi:hypothetical protein